MIIDISDETFKDIMKDEKLHLPIRWDGVNFLDTLEKLYKVYIKKIETIKKDDNRYSTIECDVESIKTICGLIQNAVSSYLNGFPSTAYDCLSSAMRILMRNQLKVYQKSISRNIENFKDDLDLYRVAKVSDYVNYGRERIFHTPYNMRSKVSTNRYSIAGYPSLYLATNVELCCKEIHLNPHSDLAIASRFRIERNEEYNNTHISVIELAVKPQDFIERNIDDRINHRYIDRQLLDNSNTKRAYMLWYPLIAACSFIRPNKNDPFAAEYIVPQLLMQWVRIEISQAENKTDKLIGLRYFSCASIKASELGFNYVFPVSGNQKSTYPFCSILMKAFKLTKPHYISEYEDVNHCEWVLKHDRDLDYIDC